MSNMVDVLIVGGPKNGMVLCQPRPVPASIDHAGTSYTMTVHGQYHVARYDTLDGADVDAAIAASGLTPSWDL